MSVLLVATNTTPAGAATEAARGNRQRIDYLSLAERVAGAFVDYNAVSRNLRPLRRIEGKLRIDIVQAWAVACSVRARGSKVVFSLSERVGIPLAYLLPKTVCHVVQVHHLLSPRKLHLLSATRLPQRWHATLVNTRAEEEALPGLLRLPRERVRRLRDKVDTAFWRPDAGTSENDSRSYLWSCGLSYRDYPALFQALARVPAANGHIHLGSNWAASGSLLGGADPPPNVHVSRDFLSAGDLREYYRRSRFVVLPIRETTLWNAGSNVALEAQAMGKPVIATRTPGTIDYVRDGETGILVPPGDAAAMADAIRALWNDPDRAAAMGRRAREWVESAFSFDAWLDEAASYLNELLLAPTPS